MAKLIANAVVQAIYRKKHHTPTASGSRTALDTPKPADGDSRKIGGRDMPLNEYLEVKRYFELFKDSLEASEPDFILKANETTGLVILYHRYTKRYQWEFSASAMKNYYCEFRLCRDMNAFMERITSQGGVFNYFGSGHKTPDALRKK